jgi:hypothetical protein
MDDLELVIDDAVKAAKDVRSYAPKLTAALGINTSDEKEVLHKTVIFLLSKLPEVIA